VSKAGPGDVSQRATPLCAGATLSHIISGGLCACGRVLFFYFFLFLYFLFISLAFLERHSATDRVVENRAYYPHTEPRAQPYSISYAYPTTCPVLGRGLVLAKGVHHADTYSRARAEHSTLTNWSCELGSRRGGHFLVCLKLVEGGRREFEGLLNFIVHFWTD
jgi:hypothetical protein